MRFQDVPELAADPRLGFKEAFSDGQAQGGRRTWDALHWLYGRSAEGMPRLKITEDVLESYMLGYMLWRRLRI